MGDLIIPWRELIFGAVNRALGKFEWEAMLARAERKTGLLDWGNLEFREPFRILIEALQNEARLNQVGFFILRYHYHRLLCNLLKLVEDWRHYPEIAEVPLKDPIFIVGFPRTGTTYLHSLLAQDPAFRSLRYWELLFPSPPPVPSTPAGDPRIKQARRFVYWIDKISPRLSTIHELDAMGVEECCFIFDHFFLDNIHHLVFDVPSYIEWYDRHDPVPSYRFHRRMLQHYGWKHSFDRFVLKAPRHLYCLDALLTVYPNARIVWTHRDPLTALPSLCSLSETARRIVSDDIDTRRIGHLCLEYWEKDFHAGYRARERANPRQFFDVPYSELIRDPMRWVRNIYEYFGFDFTKSFEFGLSNYLSNMIHQSHRVHRYDLSDYQLASEEIEERLSNYFSVYRGILNRYSGDKKKEGR